MDLITGPLDGYDYLTFAFALVAVVAGFYVLIQIGGLPGKIAERRNHPHADSVKIVGWIGLFTVFPWIHAIIWAYHDSLTIDVRKFPDGKTVDTDAEPVKIENADNPDNSEAGAPPARQPDPA